MLVVRKWIAVRLSQQLSSRKTLEISSGLLVVQLATSYVAGLSLANKNAIELVLTI